MVVVDWRIVGLTAGAGCIVLLLSLCFDPMRSHAKLLKSSVTGLGLLLLWNTLLPRLGVNPLSALVAGSLGVPGLGLLAVLARLP